MGEPTNQKPNRGPSCPICGRPAVQDARPFCSRRCADVDLGRWLKGVYRVPTDERPEDDEAAGPGRRAEDDDA